MDFDICNESGNAVLQTIHSSEGGRALKLIQKRNKMKNELEQAKSKIEHKNNKNIKFGGSIADIIEEKFREQTVGLVSADEFREKRIKLQEFLETSDNKKKVKPKSWCEKICKTKLSFEEEEEDDGYPAVNEESVDEDKKGNDRKRPLDFIETNGFTNHEESNLKRKHLGKDPTVDTNFLPDPERDARLQKEKSRLIEEYYKQEEISKNEILQVTYSYWDGTGHRRSVKVSKGTTIQDFLDICRKDLEKDFCELRTVNTENLMYIKEDLILPHNVTFYELIKNKVRGKSGPLFHFDVHDDVRILNDVRIEKDESHAGKVVDRKWYEKNKHIFPASRWETYNPNKTFDKYTIHGDKDHSRDII